jgi:demethylmenaquinone methyltransferase/2-methoxy-6-polyprenyl-1,4-benzoquinol methylase
VGAVGAPDRRWQDILPPAPWGQRRRALRSIFEAIAPSYDRLNRLLSLGLDARWRTRAALEAVGPDEHGALLDLASGTGELASALCRRAPAAMVLRLDLSGSLLLQGARKLHPTSIGPPLVAEMESLPLRAGSCSAVTMGFALRHVRSLEGLLQACASILCPGGRVAFVDMALPDRGLWSRLYGFYFRRCLPRAAAVLGGRREAYELMVRSVERFDGWHTLSTAALRAGFVEPRTISLSGGAAAVFVARLPLPAGAPGAGAGGGESAVRPQGEQAPLARPPALP